MRPIVLIGSILRKLDKLLLGRFHIRSSKEMEYRFAQEIQREMSFLFDEHGGVIVPDETIKYPRPFDYASVVVALDDSRFRFFRGRGDLRAWVAPKYAPSDWEDLPLVLSLLDDSERSESRPFLFWNDLARVLRPRMARLKEALSESNYSELRVRLSDVRERERAITRQWEKEINRGLYPDR